MSLCFIVPIGKVCGQDAYLALYRRVGASYSRLCVILALVLFVAYHLLRSPRCYASTLLLLWPGTTLVIEISDIRNRIKIGCRYTHFQFHVAFAEVFWFHAKF
jgi:hypothetical protein